MTDKTIETLREQFEKETGKSVEAGGVRDFCGSYVYWLESRATPKPTAWISVKDRCIPSGEFVLAGLTVRNNKTKKEWFEQRIIMVDEDVLNIDLEVDSAWEYDDFTHWQPLPEAPR